MEKMIEILKRNWLYPVGAIIGGVGGYLYWFYIGCESGNCSITSSPINSVIWGTIMGVLLFSIFKRGDNK
ncbi:hypothetical protein [Dysgonomonas sp. ZJ279]|uniref:hypothetical protein n=1 Tax=Dysgonomonas sp. ZJ279 TaxID=2709796 RepID=UPI003977DADB